MPGVSRNTTWLSSSVTMPRITLRVVWGLSVTMEIFSPTRRLRRVDLPEFGRPMMETKPDFISPSFVSEQEPSCEDDERGDDRRRGLQSGCPDVRVSRPGSEVFRRVRR